MANYRSIAEVTPANRAAAYQAVAAFFLHMDPLDINVLSVVYNSTTKHVDTVTSSSIPTAQHDHLGIEEA